VHFTFIFVFLKEGRGGMVSEKSVLRRVLELYRLDVTGGWRKLHTAKKLVICQTLLWSKITKMMG
jgi:hypothetical protein